MATLILFRAPDCQQPGDSFEVARVDTIDECLLACRSATHPCAIVIAPDVAEAERIRAIRAAVDHGGYFLVMEPGDSLGRVRRLVRAALRQ